MFGSIRVMFGFVGNAAGRKGSSVWNTQTAPGREVVCVRVNRIGQELHVVAQPGVDRQSASHAPLVLNERTEIRVRLELLRRAERLLKRIVVAAQKITQRREVVNTLKSAGKENVETVVE